MNLNDVKKIMASNPVVKITKEEEDSFTYSVQGFCRTVWIEKDKYGKTFAMFAKPSDCFRIYDLEEIQEFADGLKG